MDTTLSAPTYQPFLNALDTLGFCTFPILGDGEIAALSSLYQRFFAEKSINELYVTHNANPIADVLAINKGIKEIVSEPLRAVFPDYDYFIGHFVAKPANSTDYFSLHQDWNIVDEKRYRSYQVWIPLQFTYPDNGGIFAVAGSHKFFYNFRSGSYGIPFLKFDDKIKSLVTDVIVPPGSVYIFQNGLFHGSYPNQTNEKRIAVIANFVEKIAPTYYFHKNTEKQQTDLYEISGETLLQHLPNLEKGIVDADLKLVGSRELCSTDNQKVSPEILENEFKAMFGKASPKQIKQLHIAKSPELEQKLNEDGYTVVDFLDEETVRIFKNEYNLRFGNIDRTPGRFTTLQHTNAIVKKEIHDFIVKNVDASMRKYFQDFIIPVSQFYTKKAFTSGDIDLHADSSLLINHQLEPHYAIWVPLIDVNSGNGTLTVVPKSHRINRAFFAASLGGYHQDHLEWLRQFEVPITLKAGQAVIFDNNLLHNSTANTSAFDRLCFTFRTTHFASQYYSFFTANKEMGFVEISQEKQDYYMNEQWDGDVDKVTGKLVGTHKKGIVRVEKTELEQILKG